MLVVFQPPTQTVERLRLQSAEIGDGKEIHRQNIP